mmetsp:Transcript_24254/g.79075  ORF Transcript_24254/g.79075 Transcript_24254/m.79075 type:complete len:272 (+) Transcript_24254:2115-2930(+)
MEVRERVEFLAEVLEQEANLAMERVLLLLLLGGRLAIGVGELAFLDVVVGVELRETFLGLGLVNLWQVAPLLALLRRLSDRVVEAMFRDALLDEVLECFGDLLRDDGRVLLLLLKLEVHREHAVHGARRRVHLAAHQPRLLRQVFLLESSNAPAHALRALLVRRLWSHLLRLLEQTREQLLRTSAKTRTRRLLLFVHPVVILTLIVLIRAWSRPRSQHPLILTFLLLLLLLLIFLLVIDGGSRSCPRRLPRSTLLFAPTPLVLPSAEKVCV